MLPPELTPSPDSLPELWSLFVRCQEPLQRRLLERAAAIPSLAPLLPHANTPEAVARREHGQVLTRAALVDGDWDPYLEDLHRQGRTYARMGMTLADWYSLVEVYRVVLVPAAVEEYRARGAALTSMLLAIDGFVDRAMREIGNAYVQENERMVRAVEEQRDLYAKLFEASPLGFCVWRQTAETTFDIVSTNPALLRMRAGLALGEARRAELTSLLYTNGRHCLATGEPREWTVALPHGTTLQLWLVRLDASHVGQIVEDVTAIQKATRQLERSVSELERSNRDLDQFAYVASHDLKAPLRDIDNLSRWLVEDLGADLPEASARHVTRLRDRVGRMERLLDDLLGYSRAGRVNGPNRRFDLLEALESATAMVAVPAGFRIVAASGSLLVNTPRTPFEVVLRNLLGNALKHHDRPEGTLTVSWVARDEQVEVTVADDGPGIPDPYHERVFTMFQTLKPRDQVEGSGMGLAIVRKVVEAFGGTVHLRATSDDGRGATFVFTWPQGRAQLADGDTDGAGNP